LSQGKSCKEIFARRTKKNSNKTFLKNDLNTKFHLHSLKVSANAKIAMRCFENFEGENPPPLVARMLQIALYFIISRAKVLHQEKPKCVKVGNAQVISDRTITVNRAFRKTLPVSSMPAILKQTKIYAAFSIY